MQAYRVETIIEKDGSITLQHLPFQAGESIEVIVLARAAKNLSKERYPLRGTVLKYTDPLEPVAEDDWAALR